MVATITWKTKGKIKKKPKNAQLTKTKEKREPVLLVVRSHSQAF
jgi:hypothetical protein